MGGCQYRFNPSELYQRTGPGMAPESHCGGRTYALADEPEMFPVTVVDEDGSARTEYRPTGSFLPRAHDDPYCPAHGGTPPPPPRVLTWAELQVQAQELEVQRRSLVDELARAGHEIPQVLQPALTEGAS
jgi:hypothetical protein